MPRYIDADAMINNVHINDYLDVKVDGKTLKKWIKAQPTADVAPVVHAHWIINPKYSIVCNCSNCGVAVRGGLGENYCFNCGAKMDEE